MKQHLSSEERVNILLVDDRQENLLAMEAALESLGHNLVMAGSGREALEHILRTSDFAVIVLDIQMPEMDGFETAALIRRREKSQQIPIIFLTAFSTSSAEVFRGYSIGAVDYLIKPIVPEVLRAKVAVFVDLFRIRKQLERVNETLEQRVAERTQALKKSEEKFRGILENIRDVFYRIDRHGIIQMISPSIARYGYSTQTLVGTDIRLICVAPMEVDRLIKLLMEKPSLGDLEIALRCKDGTTVVTSTSARLLIDSEGRPNGIEGILHDITDRRQAEQEREQLLLWEQAARATAEKASRLKDEFLATVSHELRTPLTAMLGWARMLRQGKLDEATAERALETIERNAKAQAQLIEDLLDVSRIITGNLRLDVRRVELVSVLEAALDTARPAAEAKGIQIHTVFDPAVGSASGDPNRLQQIFWNLLSNAIKFTPKGGRVEVRLDRTDSQFQVTVSDTGIGIRSEFLPFVFDRFRQADSSITRLHGGLGLGLALVRHMVELHGGTVHAESPGEGKGATFTVCLPLPVTGRDTVASENHSMVREGENIGNHPHLLNGLRVLVVEDEPDTREWLSTVFTLCGASVTATASASEALETLSQLKPNVLVSDIGMPGMDGYEFIHRVRALESELEAHIPAVALTAYAKAEDRQRALSAGYERHLPKPVEPTELVGMVASLVGRIRDSALHN